MRRVALFCLILAVAAGFTHSVAGTVLAGTSVVILGCVAIAIGGVIDLIILFGGGKPAAADKIIAFLCGR